MDRQEALAALVDLPKIQDVCVARLNPGDVIVVESDYFVSAEQARRIRADLELIWPGHKIVVCGQIRLKIVREGTEPKGLE